MFKGSRGTLLLVIWIFWIGSGLLTLYGTYATFSSGGRFTFPDIVITIINLCYLAGGLALASKLDTLLPRYRSEIVRLVTIGFCINVALSLWGMFMAVQDSARTEDADTLFILSLSVVSIALGFLIYKIIINSINVVSHVPLERQSTTQTVIYWVIVVAFFVTMLVAILWDPATNSFNVL